jgi:hypothetical protein
MEQTPREALHLDVHICNNLIYLLQGDTLHL